MAQTNNSVEKYMLDEMSDQERDEFEDHLFACPDCSERVRQDFTLIENLKTLPLSAVLPAPAKAEAGWRDWLRIPSLVPTFAAVALACVAGYQQFGGGGMNETARMLPQLAVLQQVTKGADGVVTIQVNRKSLKVFELGVNADSLPAGSFICELQDASGKRVGVPFSTEIQNTAFDLRLQLPIKDFPPGRYQLLLRPAAESDSITYPFAVQDTK